MSSGSKIISWQRGPQFTRKMKCEDLIPVLMPECQYRSTFTHFTAIHLLYHCLYQLWPPNGSEREQGYWTGDRALNP